MAFWTRYTHLIYMYLLMFLAITDVIQAVKTTNHDHNDYEMYASGRSREEYDYVKERVRQIEVKMMKKFGKLETDMPQKTKNMVFGAIDDILLTAKDANRWFDAISVRKKRKIVNFKNQPDKKWSMPIKYQIDITFTNQTSQSIIRKAIAAWEKETCVRFKEVTSEPSEKYLFFTNVKSAGCKSYVGRVTDSDIYDKNSVFRHSNKQPIYLEDPDCFFQGGTSMHEIGHALGLIHEAQRNDRDFYITIQYQNIKYGHVSNFLKRKDPSTVSTLGIPYDYGSVMHYGAYAYSYNPKSTSGETIIPVHREIAKWRAMGQLSEIGFFDAKVINLAYCHQSTSYLSCQNRGYTDPNHPERCKCPAEYNGQTCEDISPSSSGCSPSGGNIIHSLDDYISEKEFSLYSPNYRSNQAYIPGDHCFWNIQVPRDYKLKWWIDTSGNNYNNSYFFAMCQNKFGGCIDWLEIKQPFEVRGERLCGSLNRTVKEDFLKTHYSDSHTLQFSFRSFEDLYVPKENSEICRRGFHLRYKIVSATENKPSNTNIWDWYEKSTTKKSPQKPRWNRLSTSTTIYPDYSVWNWLSTKDSLKGPVVRTNKNPYDDPWSWKSTKRPYNDWDWLSSSTTKRSYNYWDWLSTSTTKKPSSTAKILYDDNWDWLSSTTMKPFKSTNRRNPWQDYQNYIDDEKGDLYKYFYKTTKSMWDNDNGNNYNYNHRSVNALVGGTVGGVIGLCILLTTLAVYTNRRKRQANHDRRPIYPSSEVEIAGSLGPPQFSSGIDETGNGIFASLPTYESVVSHEQGQVGQETSNNFSSGYDNPAYGKMVSPPSYESVVRGANVLTFSPHSSNGLNATAMISSGTPLQPFNVPIFTPLLQSETNPTSLPICEPIAALNPLHDTTPTPLSPSEPVLTLSSLSEPVHTLSSLSEPVHTLSSLSEPVHTLSSLSEPVHMLSSFIEPVHNKEGI